MIFEMIMSIDHCETFDQENAHQSPKYDERDNILHYSEMLSCTRLLLCVYVRRIQMKTAKKKIEQYAPLLVFLR